MTVTAYRTVYGFYRENPAHLEVQPRRFASKRESHAAIECPLPVVVGLCGVKIRGQREQQCREQYHRRASSIAEGE